MGQEEGKDVDNVRITAAATPSEPLGVPPLVDEEMATYLATASELRRRGFDVPLLPLEVDLEGKVEPRPRPTVQDGRIEWAPR